MQNRKFVSKDLKIKSWESIDSYYSELETREINSINDLEKWMHNRSELDSVLEEDLAWRYIKMNCDTTDKSLTDDFNFFVTEIEPNISKYSNILDEKFIESKFTNQLDKKKYFIPIRTIKRKLQIFREKNIPIFAMLQKEEQEYGAIAANMTIKYDGEEITLQKAANYLKNTDRDLREKVYFLINNRRLQEVDNFNNILTKLIAKRNEVAKNTDFENYRDYKFVELNRFDYTIDDCVEFHNSIKSNVCPIVNRINQNRKESLNLDVLKPWDLDVDINLKTPLKPFENTEELIDKSIKCFTQVRPKYGEYLSKMNELGFLDLDARKGKAPGGFNYPLYESNIPFIFTNATGNLRDVETICHEGGHAIHSIVSSTLELVDFKELPSEVAELASMSMELISMEHWNVFFENKEELIRAKQSQLEGIIGVLPWIAIVDKFQHWLYLNPNHSVEERKNNWVKIAKEFGSNVIDFTGCEDFYANTWQKQLHIFEVPFYYIEYAMAQLGAIAIWRNYKRNPEKTLDNYEKALRLGYSVTIPEIYETAGIKFNFSNDYVKELMLFVNEELAELYK
ncbi:MAG: M3 family oligoendopeptidase [Bacteroidales bacterium]|nr:M3 family oligoendopeptidase [Bacteroidales bacterium]